MTSGDIQKHFIQQIKDSLPSEASLVSTLSELLYISTDSAYRRIRGETSLTFDEIKTLAARFGLSVDALIGTKNQAVTFNYSTLNIVEFSFEKYLKSILDQLKEFNRFQQKKILYAAKDIPIFQLFYIPEIAAFKIFFWAKSIIGIPGFEKKKFALKDIDEAFNQVGQQILSEYLRIPTQEIWNMETINSSLKQIQFYYESGLFEDPKDALKLTDHLQDLLEHIKVQAEAGVKFLHKLQPTHNNENYQLYFNEIVIADNTIIVEVNDRKVAYITHNVMNYLNTTNPVFCEDTYGIVESLRKKSTLISGVAEKQRNQFFNAVQEKVNQIRNKLTAPSYI